VTQLISSPRTVTHRVDIVLGTSIVSNHRGAQFWASFPSFGRFWICLWAWMASLFICKRDVYPHPRRESIAKGPQYMRPRPINRRSRRLSMSLPALWSCKVWKIEIIWLRNPCLTQRRFEVWKLRWTVCIESSGMIGDDRDSLYILQTWKGWS